MRGEISTPSDTQIRMTRLFDAPRRLLFEAMVKPEHIKNWWGRLGEGYSVPVCEVDLRVGGKWRFVNRHPQGEVAFRGEYWDPLPFDAAAARMYGKVAASTPTTPPAGRTLSTLRGCPPAAVERAAGRR